MRVLTKDEMRAYVEEKLKTTPVITAKKVRNTLAIPGTVGEEVITYTTDSDGNEVIEKVGMVELDQTTGQPGWILTKVDENNQPVIDNNGHLNQYIVDDSVFQRTYESSNDGADLYSKSQIEKFIKIDEDLCFDTEHGNMTVMSNGYIKVTDSERILGISERDFNDTYNVVTLDKKEEVTTGFVR